MNMEHLFFQFDGQKKKKKEKKKSKHYKFKGKNKWEIEHGLCACTER